jgi:hypothetical protein
MAGFRVRRAMARVSGSCARRAVTANSSVALSTRATFGVRAAVDGARLAADGVRAGVDGAGAEADGVRNDDAAALARAATGD